MDYDEFGLFRENADEFELPWRGEPKVTRTAVDVGGGQEISALVWGDGRPELVLVHGGAQNAHTWDTVALALDLPLVAIDMPGHGHSDWRPDGRYLPDAMVNYLARLGWSHGDEELFTREQLVAWFDGQHLARSPAQWDAAKLNWVNAHRLKQTPDAGLVPLVRAQLARRGVEVGADAPVEAMCALFKDRCATTAELADWLVMYFVPVTPNEEDIAAHVTDAVLHVVAEYPEEEHVPAKVAPAAVEEHRRHQRAPVRERNHGREVAPGAVLARHHTPGLDERLQGGFGRVIDLEEERHDVQRDERHRDERHAHALQVVVAHREHAITPGKS